MQMALLSTLRLTQTGKGHVRKYRKYRVGHHFRFGSTFSALTTFVETQR
jgi:hypothetical protein